MSTTIVTTTVRLPVALSAYCSNLARFGHSDVTFVVIGDRSTPSDVGDYLTRLTKESGFAIDYWDVARQVDHLAAQPELDRLLPYDSIQRRNLGFLVAAASGGERIVSVDDDNWPTDDDFLGNHAVVGTPVEMSGVSSTSAWFNTVGLLDVIPQRPLYHRGFPTTMRGLNERLTYAPIRGRVVVNAGLWTGVPDVDAASHLDAPVRSNGFRAGCAHRLAIAPGTNVVFNTQNTAFHRELLPGMFLIPMGDRIGSLVVGRHDDIWMSIFLKAVTDHLGDLVSVGKPLVDQQRNEHDLFQDALVELPAMRLTNGLIQTLAGVRLSGSDYLTSYQSLIEALRSGAQDGPYSPEEAAYVHQMTNRMEVWALVVARHLRG